MAPGLYAKLTFILLSVFVLLVYKEIPLLPALRLDVVAIMIVQPMRYVTMSQVQVSQRKNVSLSVPLATVHKELIVRLETTEKFVPVGIL